MSLPVANEVLHLGNIDHGQRVHVAVRLLLDRHRRRYPNHALVRHLRGHVPLRAGQCCCIVPPVPEEGIKRLEFGIYLRSSTARRRAATRCCCCGTAWCRTAARCSGARSSSLAHWFFRLHGHWLLGKNLRCDAGILVDQVELCTVGDPELCQRSSWGTTYWLLTSWIKSEALCLGLDTCAILHLLLEVAEGCPTGNHDP
mmetsp:Transcript_45655/g.105469  ORF Transcript_45655/g.105469 Transcript_45655/m.105469 type:complete len:200 (-) Transcript_45655:7-606(-)